MSSLLEVIVTSDSNNSLWTTCVWDSHTGTSLMTYKGGGTAEAKTLSFIGNDYLAAVERSKPILHVWPLNSQQTVQGMRFILPGRATALAVTRDGAYIVAGIDEKIYLWQTASGNLLTIINRHYQKIGLLKFTPDGRFFISAAEDGMVMVWSIGTVSAHPEIDLVTQTSAGHHDPVYIFSDHSLPITDQCISKTGMHGRLCTVSSDRTCKIYNLSTGEMLLNLVFDAPLSAVIFDDLELNIFVGTNEGQIYQYGLTNPPRSRDLLINTEANCLKFISHTKAISCLSISLNGETLLSGAQDEQVILWHIPSRQPIRIIKHKGAITNAFFTVNYPAIFRQEFSPNIVLHSLERTMEKDADDVTEIEVLVNKKIHFWPQSRTEFECSSNSEVLESEIKLKEKALKDEVKRLKAINGNMYGYIMQKEFEMIPSHTGSNKSKKNKRKNEIQ